MAAPEDTRPRRHVLVIVLVALGTITGFFAIDAIWVNRQALNTDNWADTSSRLLESPAIRSAVAAYLVDEAYTAYDVPAELSQVLPPRAKPLAGPAAGALRDVAQQGVEALLQRPRVQGLWETANRRAHQRLMSILEGGSGAVSTSGGTVTLDLGTLLQETSDGIGVGQRVSAKVPPGTGVITIARSDQLATAQDAVRILRKLPIVLLVVTLAFFAAAIALAGRRREALRSVGIGFVVAGIAALLTRGAAGSAVVNAFATTSAAKPAAEDVWTIATSQLVTAAGASIGYGVVIVLAAWLAGPTRAAVGARTWGAPYLRDARYAYGALAALLLLIIVWAPTPATRNALALLVMALLLAFGVELLRRQTAREHPDATLEEAGERRRAWLHRMRASASGAFERTEQRVRSHGDEQDPAPAVDTRLDALERLIALRDRGALTPEEFEAEKRALLGLDSGQTAARPAGPLRPP